jgi:hypothetical protein
VAASNRAGATSDEIMVRPVTFGSMASFITSGMEAAGGLWVGQLVIAFLLAALFNFTAGYWLAASLTILLVLAVVTWVQLEKGIAPRVKPFHRPSSQTPAAGPGENRRPGPPCRNQGGLSSPGDSYHSPPLKITTFLGSERRDCRPGADMGRFEPHEADCAEPRPRVIG